MEIDREKQQRQEKAFFFRMNSYRYDYLFYPCACLSLDMASDLYLHHD